MEESLVSLKNKAGEAFHAWMCMDEKTPEPIEKCLREWLNHCLWKVERKIRQDREG